MEKKHVNPEFQVICQNEANAKFFVASFMGSKQESPDGSASQYGTETQGDNSTVNSYGGFTF